jgi:hypothetical protein
MAAEVSPSFAWVGMVVVGGGIEGCTNANPGWRIELFFLKSANYLINIFPRCISSEASSPSQDQAKYTKQD